MDQLKAQIRAAFPASPYYGPITECTCDECTDIKNGLRHKRWDELSAEFIEFTCSPNLFSPEAFREFIPAYLLYSLDDLDAKTVVLELTVYNLSPHVLDEDDGPPEQSYVGEALSRCKRRAEGMSTAQIQAIRAFLEFVKENAKKREWLTPFIDSALRNVWR